jgi:gliding motility-associated-like protein
LISGSGTIADSSITNTLVTNLSTGSNVFRWTVNNNGCTSYSDVEISNNLIEAIAGTDQVNCADTAYLEANNASPGEGTWGVQGGSGSANFDDTSDPYTTVRNLDQGENILTWTINYEGCQSVSEISVTNNKPSDADAGDNKDTCEDSIILSASSPEVGSGLWTIVSGGGTFEDDTDPSSTVDTLKFGSNIYRWTVSNEDCTSYDDVEINYNFIEATVGDDQEICADNTFLNGNNASPGEGTWSVVGGAGAAYFADSNDATTEVYDLSQGTNVLMWTIEYEGCTSSVEVTITNNTPSTAYAGNTQELCTDETTLDATSVDIGTGIWSVLTGSATIASDQLNEPKAVITGLSKGDNVLRWTVTSDNGLCTSTDEVTISNDEPSDPYAGADEEYCSSTVVLKASEPDYGTGAWSIIDGGGNFDDTALAEATITNLTEGENILRWTVTEGQCSKYDEITILNNEPTTADAGPDIEDCKDYAELDANEPTQGDGYWSLVSGNATFVDSTDAFTTVQDLTFGENILMWNIVKGNCSSTDEISVFNQVPDQAEAGTDRETCDDYLTLNANDPDSGEGVWTVISGSGEFVDSTNPTTIVKSLGFGENQFKWTVAYGECSTEDVVEVVSNKADPDAGEDDITYESSYALKASNPGDDIEATWTVIGGTGDFEDDTYFNTTVSNLTEGVNTYRWTMEVNDCVTYDEVSIEYRVVPDAMFVTDTTKGCYPLTVEFTNYSENGTEYIWDFGDGETSTERNPVHTFEDPGYYTVILTAPGPDDVNGEYQTDITVYDHPTADFSYSPDEVYVPGDVLRCYSLSVDAETYYWEFGDGGSSTDVNPSYTYVEEGVYDISLSVESEYGCVDEIIKEDAVTAYMEGFVVFPNSFMPRPDGGTSSTVGGGESNTVFRPVYQDVDTYTLQIFNRWGQLIYQSNDIDEGWNGFYNGVLAQQAVYVYKATGTFVSGTVFNKSGSVLLVR